MEKHYYCIFSKTELEYFKESTSYAINDAIKIPDNQKINEITASTYKERLYNIYNKLTRILEN